LNLLTPEPPPPPPPPKPPRAETEEDVIVVAEVCWIHADEDVDDELVREVVVLDSETIF